VHLGDCGLHWTISVTYPTFDDTSNLSHNRSFEVRQSSISFSAYSPLHWG